MPLYDCGDRECEECQRAFGPNREKAIRNFEAREVAYSALEKAGDDIVNAFFRKHYPPLDHGKFTFSTADGAMKRYEGDGQEKRIFPRMVCADGFEMSVQGHYGAYSLPRDDFADRYQAVEIMCKADPMLDEHGGHNYGDERIYGYVPVDLVERVIAAHGGLR